MNARIPAGGSQASLAVLYVFVWDRCGQDGREPHAEMRGLRRALHHGSQRLIADLSSTFSNNSAVVDFKSGCTSRGAISTSGSSTNRRSWRHGWGNFKNSVLLSTSP